MTNPWPLLSTLSSSNLTVRVVVQRFVAVPDHDLVFTVHKDDISREQLKELLYEEIMTFQPAPIT